MPREPVPAYFPNLDVLRAIAVAAVFGFHFVSYNQIVLPEKPLSFLVLQGWLGANLFFTKPTDFASFVEIAGKLRDLVAALAV